METSENNATSSPSSTPDASLRRRSGRVVRAPRKFSPDTYPSQNASQNASQNPSQNPSQNGKSAPKRKRAPDLEDEDEDEENQEPDAEQGDGELTDEEDNDEEEEPEPEDDDDEPTPKAKKSKSSRNSRSKKPATKRAKVNGDAPENNINVSAPAQHAPAVKLPNRPKKTARIAVTRLQDDGLYGKRSNRVYHVPRSMRLSNITCSRSLRFGRFYRRCRLPLVPALSGKRCRGSH